MDHIFCAIDNCDSLIFKYENNACINLLFLHKKYNNIENIKNDDELLSFLDKFILNTSYHLLFSTFYEIEYKDIDYNQIICIYKIVFSLFNNRVDSGLITYKNSLTNYSILQKKLIIRLGIVELRACNATNDDLIIKCIDELSTNINNEKKIINYSESKKKCWITIYHDYESYLSYISMLMTNAGFYISNNTEKSLECFTFFKNNYIDAISNTDYLIDWSFLNCYSLNILNNIKPKQINLIKYPSRYDIVNLFDNKNILFLTPFKNLIDNHYNSGNIYKLFKVNNFTNISLHTIEAFLTTYPNVKHDNFIETYEYYKLEIDKMFLENKYDIFTCSVGCYGAMICNYVYKKYNITSIYIGNVINVYFGICFRNKYTDDMNKEIFLKSDLNLRYKNLENIENNLYG